MNCWKRAILEVNPLREEIELIPLDGVEVYLEDVGPADAPVLLFLHGGPGGSSYTFREEMGDVLEDYRLLYLDQRGGGRSPELPPDPDLFTLDALVEDLEDLRNHLAIEGWTLLSHGFGGMVALEYARRYPQRVQGQLMVAPWISFPLLAQQLHRAAQQLRGGSQETPPERPADALAEAFADLDPKVVFDHLLFPSEHTRLQHEWIAETELIGGNAGEMFVRNGLWDFDYTPYLSQAQVAPLVLVGSADGSSYPQQADLVASLAQGTLEVLPAAGHFPWLDQPEAFIQALYEALDQLGLES